MQYHRSYLLQVLSGSSKDYNTATCHIFTAMFTNTFDNCICTRVTNCKTFSCNTVDKGITAGSTIQSNVSDDDIFFRFISCFFRNFYDQLTT